jgi:uncharacterized delta-60 repeat protein
VGDVWPSGTERNFGIARYMPGGALDTSFSTDGINVISLGANDQAVAVAIEPVTRKIVVAGQTCPASWSPCDGAVVRFNPGGGLDSTFNGTGKRIDDIGGGDNGYLGVAIDATGRIVVAGYMYKGPGDTEFAVARYTSLGALDTTFSGDGKQVIRMGAGVDEANEVAIQADGKIVVAGFVCDTSYANCNFGVARLNENGSLDTTFSGDGKQITNFGADERARDMVLQPDGKIILVGSKATSTTAYFAIARYNTDGNLDATFAGTGKKVLDFTGNNYPDTAFSVALQTNGKILVCGYAYDGSTDNMALARLNTTGGLDATFSGDGKMTVDFGRHDYCVGLSVQPDGKYLLAGTSTMLPTAKWVLARVLP